MESDGRSQRVGPNHSRAATPVSTVAEVFRAETDDWEVAEPSESQSACDARQVRVGPSAARDLAKNKIVQLERALEAMGMEGPAVQATKLELEKARTTSKKPPLNMEIEEARKFITRSMRRLKEMEEERQVEERLLSEAQENLKKMLAEQEKGPSHPAPSGLNMLQAERDNLVAELQSRGRRVEMLHPPQSSRGRAAKRQVWSRDIPNSEQELTDWMCTKHLEL